VRNKTDANVKGRMKGFHAKPELIFFVIVAIAILLLIFGGGILQRWFG